MFLDFEGIENDRDLGGLLRADGRKTKPGLLLRTGRLEKATDADIARLADMGLACVIPDDPSYTANEVRADFKAIYRKLARSTEADEAYAEFFRLLLASEGRPVLWHCTQGKDRTGAAALLLLTALGFDEDTIFRDYLLTNEFTQGLMDRVTAMEHPPFSADIAREVFFVREENLRTYGKLLELEYGSVPAYMELVLGVGPDEIETLETLYLDEGF